MLWTTLEERTYKIFGYKGKQVRDNIHALDVARAIHAFIEQPQSGAVFNIGGGRENSVSILEAFAAATAITGNRPEALPPTHICPSLCGYWHTLYLHALQQLGGNSRIETRLTSIIAMRTQFRFIAHLVAKLTSLIATDVPNSIGLTP